MPAVGNSFFHEVTVLVLWGDSPGPVGCPLPHPGRTSPGPLFLARGAEREPLFPSSSHPCAVCVPAPASPTSPHHPTPAPALNPTQLDVVQSPSMCSSPSHPNSGPEPPPGVFQSSPPMHVPEHPRVTPCTHPVPRVSHGFGRQLLLRAARGRCAPRRWARPARGALRPAAVFTSAAASVPPPLPCGRSPARPGPLRLLLRSPRQCGAAAPRPAPAMDTSDLFTSCKKGDVSRVR